MSKLKRRIITDKIKGLYFRKDRKAWYLSRLLPGRIRIQKNLGTADYAEAVEKAATIIANVLSGAEVVPPNSIDAELNSYLAERTAVDAKNRMRPATERWTRDVVRRFVAYRGKVSVGAVTSADARGYYKQLLSEVSRTSANQYINGVRPFFGWLLDRRKVTENPFAAVELVEANTKTRLRWATFEEYTKLIEECPSEDLTFIMYCGFHAGMRRAEIDNARPEWFDLDRKLIRIISEYDRDDHRRFIQKDGEAMRTVPMTDAFHSFLLDYGLRSPYMLRPDVILGKNRYRYDYIKAFRTYTNLHGKGWVTPHVMRHSFASFNVQSGIDIWRVASWLGDDVETTQKHYAHLAPDDRTIELVQQLARKRMAGKTGKAKPKRGVPPSIELAARSRKLPTN